MPIRDRIMWGPKNPFSDPRLEGLDDLVRRLRRGERPPSVTGGRVFENRAGDLPRKERGFYHEYDVEPTVKGKDRGKLRVVLGGGDVVYVSGNHYDDFRQIVGMPL